MPTTPRLPCPGCSQPVRQRDSWRSIGGVRWHLTCAPHALGRPRDPNALRRTGRRVHGPLVTEETHRRFTARAAELGRTLPGHVLALLEADAAARMAPVHTTRTP